MNAPLRITIVLLLICAGTNLGCSGMLSSAKGARSEQLPEGGFKITERARVPLLLRSTFRNAVEAMEEGDVAKATALFQTLAAEPNAPASVDINLAIALRGAEDLEGAQVALERALEKSPKHPVALNELGITLRRRGDFLEAREQYESALAAHPEFHFARKNLAILCDLYLSDLSCALDHYRRYAADDPSDEKAQIWIADLEGRVEQGVNK